MAELEEREELELVEQEEEDAADDEEDEGDVEEEEEEEEGGGKKNWLLLQNLCLTGASTGGCVISWCGRGVQSQGFWVMGFSGAIGDLEELFTHNFIIGLLSRGSMPVLLPTPSTLTL